jgi:Tol biopolymer transport system component
MHRITSSATALALLALAAVALAAVALAAVGAARASGGHRPSPRPALAYAATGLNFAVWAADANGGHRRRLGPGAQTMLSPDGRLVAAVDTNAHTDALRIYSTGKSMTLRLFDPTVVVADPLGWSPDSRYLAVGLIDVTGSYGPGSSGLAIVDTRTGAAKTIASGYVSGASFAPGKPDRVVYDLSDSQLAGARVDLYTANADGGSIRRLTRNGGSLNPLWGKRGIAFDRERQRGGVAGPEYQIFLLAGRRTNRITNVPVGPLAEGLVPVAVSADGKHLLAEFIGTNQSDAWAIDLAGRKADRVTLGGQTVVGRGISRDGARLLVDSGAFLHGPANGQVMTVPFAGGRANVLVRRAIEPSWNQ